MAAKKGIRKYKANCKFCNRELDCRGKLQKFCNHSCHMGYWHQENPGYRHSEETKKKISLKKKGVPFAGKIKIKDFTINGEGYKQRWNGRKQVKLHHLSWCEDKNNLPYIPKGLDIHHVDGDKTNNISSNLLLIDHTDHINLHWEVRKSLQNQLY